MPADRGADLTALRAVAANRSVLDHLASHSGLKSRSSASAWDLDAWVLHSHPDLTERLEALGRGRSGGGQAVGVYGYAALVDARSVIRAVVVGNSGFALRVADLAVRDEIAANSRLRWTEFGDDWVGADAWPMDVSMAAGTEMVGRWLDSAFATVVPGPVAGIDGASRSGDA